MDDRNNYVDCSYICPERSFLVQLFLSERKKAFELAAANAGLCNRWIGGFLVVILAFIGIMNFFNTTATSVISRKKELALLEVVGMTKKQVSKMLVTEGFLYLGGAFVIAVLLVVFGAEKILANTLGTAFFFRLHLTIVPCVLMIPILVGIAYVIPKYQFEKMSRESIVERIRKE